MIQFFIIFILAYIAGSVNFSILLFKYLKKEDPRSKFSGNAGATNVYRQAGLFWAIIVLVLDMSRAVGIALLAVHVLHKDAVPFIGFGLILGNHYPCFHGFKGGKGVANYFGFTALLTPISALIAGLAWLTVYALLKTPFISSFTMVLILAAGMLIAYSHEPLAISGVLITSIFIFISHRKNICQWLKPDKDT